MRGLGGAYTVAMGADRQAEFDAWFAAQTHPEHTVPHYEHALYMRWTVARVFGRDAGAAIGEADVMRFDAPPANASPFSPSPDDASPLDDQPDGPELDAFARDFTGTVAQDERGPVTAGPGGAVVESVAVDPHPFAEEVAASVLARRDEILAARSPSLEAPVADLSDPTETPPAALAEPPPVEAPAAAAPAPQEATPEPADAPTPAPASLDLFAWRPTRVPTFPLGSLDPPPTPAAPPAPPKPKLRRAPGERWLPEPHPDPASLPVDALDVFCDGSGWLDDGTAQPAGLGVVLLWGDIVLAEAGDPIGKGTNIVAELRAIRRGIYLAATLFPGVPVTLYSDSDWSLKACLPTCEWSIREAALARLVGEIRKQFVAHGRVVFEHCKGHRGLKDAVGDPREERIIRANNRADELANIGRKKNDVP